MSHLKSIVAIFAVLAIMGIMATSVLAESPKHGLYPDGVYADGYMLTKLDLGSIVERKITVIPTTTRYGSLEFKQEVTNRTLNILRDGEIQRHSVKYEGWANGWRVNGSTRTPYYQSEWSGQYVVEFNRKTGDYRWLFQDGRSTWLYSEEGIWHSTRNRVQIPMRLEFDPRFKYWTDGQRDK